MNNGLIKVSDHFDSMFTDYQKDRLDVLETIDEPSDNLILIDISKLEPGDRVDGLVNVNSIWSDPLYNRIGDITQSNVIDKVEKKEGFSYSACDNIKVYVRPDGILVTTKGNHRTLMKIGTDGHDSTIPAKIVVHDKGLTLEQMQQIEAEDHTTDCVDRTNQLAGDRFKSAFVAGRKWAVDLDGYAEQADVSICKTNPHRTGNIANFGYFQKAINVNPELAVKITKRITLHDTDVHTTFVKAFTIFSNEFIKDIEQIDIRNNVDSLSEYIDYLFNTHGKLLQKEMCKGSNAYKKDDLFVSKIARIYNNYIKIKGYTHAGNKSKAISDKKFQGYVDKVTPLVFKGMINNEFVRTL